MLVDILDCEKEEEISVVYLEFIPRKGEYITQVENTYRVIERELKLTSEGQPDGVILYCREI